MTQHSDRRFRHKRDSTKIFNREVLVPLITKVKLLIKKVTVARDDANARHIISCLSDHQLKDIGLIRDQPKIEIGRGFFDMASGRYCDIGFRQGGLGDPMRPKISRRPED